jgi:hypothetical protein
LVYQQISWQEFRITRVVASTSELLYSHRNLTGVATKLKAQCYNYVLQSLTNFNRSLIFTCWDLIPSAMVSIWSHGGNLIKFEMEEIPLLEFFLDFFQHLYSYGYSALLNPLQTSLQTNRATSKHK